MEWCSSYVLVNEEMRDDMLVRSAKSVRRDMTIPARLACLSGVQEN